VEPLGVIACPPIAVDCILHSMEETTTSGDASPPARPRRPVGLASRINRIWRIAGTGVSFAVFGILSLSLAAIVFPLIRLFPGTREQIGFRCQYAAHLVFRIHQRLMVGLRVMQLRTHGTEKLRDRGSLVVANHPTLIDAPTLMSFMPQADCVVKAEYYDGFWLGASSKGAGYVPNRSGPQIVEDCAERLRQGRSVLIFPEGTRSPQGALGPITRGAAHIALAAEANILPVTIQCEPATLYRGLPWWSVPDRKFTMTVTVGDPIKIDDVAAGAVSRGRAARAITAALREHFERRLARVPDEHAP